MHRSQNYLQGALILTVAMAAVKIMGALFKIPLTNILGAVGMSYFATAYDLFMPVYSVAVSGLGVAVSKLVAEYTATGQERSARRTLRVAVGLFLFTGLAGCLLVRGAAGFFVRAVENPLAEEAVRAIAPAVLFSCLSAGFRGYYQGRSDMIPTATAQVLEASVKLLVGVSCAYWVIHQGMAEFAQLGTALGQPCADPEEAMSILLPRGAAGAIWGVTASTAAGCAYLAVRHLAAGRGDRGRREVFLQSRRQVLCSLLRIAAPVSLGALAAALTSLIDLMTVMNRLQEGMERSLPALLSMYGQLLPQGLPVSDLPEYLYGCYTGLALSVCNLVPALTAAFGISVLPATAAAWACRDRERTRLQMESALRMTLLAALPAGIGISVLAEPILLLLFSQRAPEAMVIAPVLEKLGLVSVLAALTSTLYSLLQGVGRADLPVKLMVLGGGVKLAINWFLLPIPTVNIQGVWAGNAGSFLLITSVGLWALCRETGLHLRAGRVVLRPLAAALGCGLSARTVYLAALSRLGNQLSVILAVGSGAVFYAILLVLLGGLGREDLEMLPQGEKIRKALEKCRFLG